ncbi:MAG: hypothetical protein HC866_21005 [Leptolyngbyaceae cyanobacterium RU_5_1]|nr:hypothetical protein [Leptolyngbyaceae cyanobacterium RU_5_1]
MPSAVLNPISLELLVSLATGPLLLGLVGGKVISEVFRDIGQLSEEVFRGDRLPLLKFPIPSTPAPDTLNND